jgi:ribosomal protein S27AE
MAMWKLKVCPRCGGNMFLDLELDGWYEQCLQCSYCRKSNDVEVASNSGQVKMAVVTNREEK